MGLERGPLSLLSTIEVLLVRKSSGSGLETRDYGRWGSAALTTSYPQKLVLTSPKIVSRSVGRVRSRTQATEYVFFVFLRDEHTWITSHLNAFAYLPEYGQSDCGFSHLEASKHIYGCCDVGKQNVCQCVCCCWKRERRMIKGNDNEDGTQD
jgi:hypothetical protein